MSDPLVLLGLCVLAALSVGGNWLVYKRLHASILTIPGVVSFVTARGRATPTARSRPAPAPQPRMVLATLAAEIQTGAYADLGDNYPAIAARLNAQPEIPNPEPHGMTPLCVTYTDILGCLTPDERLTLYERGGLVAELQACCTRERQSELPQVLTVAQPLWCAATQQAIVALLTTTEPDPDWQPMIAGPSRAQQIGLPVVRDMDVQSVM